MRHIFSCCTMDLDKIPNIWLIRIQKLQIVIFIFGFILKKILLSVSIQQRKNCVYKITNNEGNQYQKKWLQYIFQFVFSWESLEQWFPTGVPQQTRVLWGGVRGAAKYWVMCLFACFFTAQGTSDSHFFKY